MTESKVISVSVSGKPTYNETGIRYCPNSGSGNHVHSTGSGFWVTAGPDGKTIPGSDRWVRRCLMCDYAFEIPCELEQPGNYYPIMPKPEAFAACEPFGSF